MSNTEKFTYYWQGKILHTIGAPNISVMEGGKVSVVMGMSPTGDPVGFKEDQKPSYSITFSQTIFQSQEVDWRSHARLHTEAYFTVAGTARAAETYKTKVSSAEFKGDASRGGTWDVTLVGWMV